MKRNILLAAVVAVAASSCATKEESGSKVWLDFKNQTPENVLPDFSYAGYKCGNEAIPAVETLGYKTFNVVDYGAVANDGISDRAAFEATIAAVEANGGGILYFPEGEFEIHGKGDPTETIYIRSTKTILKGAGRDKTTIRISEPNEARNPKQMWTSPTVIGFASKERESFVSKVTSDAPRGTFSLTVEDAQDLKAGDWINLTLRDNDPELVKKELGEAYYNSITKPSSIKDDGLKVDDYHQIKSVEGNKLTFHEPIIYAVEAKWNWKVNRYPHLEGIGVEDITFEGDCVPDYIHHRTWNDDGGFKPLFMSYVVDSWMRRVDFVSVSEAASISTSARVSVFDVNITGKRGHAAVHSQNSSRVFIGKVFDTSDAHNLKGAGQWHAVGVTKPALGTVLWRNVWGLDANFESHATQPRATLIDACKGGFLRLRQGGAESQLPNHLGDLVIWNFEATATEPERTWQWWDSETIWTRFLPPVIVGFHGKELVFEPSQTLIEESHGTPVEPESLYEAQLIQRMGELPQWLVDLKAL